MSKLTSVVLSTKLWNWTSQTVENGPSPPPFCCSTLEPPQASALIYHPSILSCILKVRLDGNKPNFPLVDPEVSPQHLYNCNISRPGGRGAVARLHIYNWAQLTYSFINNFVFLGVAHRIQHCSVLHNGSCPSIIVSWKVLLWHHASFFYGIMVFLLCCAFHFFWNFQHHVAPLLEPDTMRW